MRLIIYDTETTGLSAAYDQIVQFAAILTDENLNELDRYAVRCRLLPHIVPSPRALVVNRVTPGRLTDEKLPSHYEAMSQIRAKLMGWSPAIFLGYNSIEFDEKFLRQAFFRTLHPLFLTNTNGNARGDLMRAAYAASVYGENKLKVPLERNGRPTFKLGQVAQANGYASKVQHEAMADVEATLFLARHIKSNLPQLWEEMLRWTSKDAVVRFISGEEKVSFTEFFFGKSYTWLVTYCGQNPGRDSRLAVFDLQFAPQNYINLSVAELIDRMNSNKKVIRELRANAQPILMPGDAAPGSVAGKSIGEAELQQRIKFIRNNREFQARIGEALAGRRPQQPPSPHVEERIFEVFPRADDELLMRRFHNTDWQNRVELIKELKDPRVREMAQRLVFTERPDILPTSDREHLEAWLSDRILAADPNVPWMTVPKALQEANDLLANASKEEAALLRDVKNFLGELTDRYTA